MNRLSVASHLEERMSQTSLTSQKRNEPAPPMRKEEGSKLLQVLFFEEEGNQLSRQKRKSETWGEINCLTTKAPWNGIISSKVQVLKEGIISSMEKAPLRGNQLFECQGRLKEGIISSKIKGEWAPRRKWSTLSRGRLNERLEEKIGSLEGEDGMSTSSKGISSFYGESEISASRKGISCLQGENRMNTSRNQLPRHRK